MDTIGDIPDREDVEFNTAPVSPAACAKVEAVKELLKNGGVSHVYLKSVDGDDLHLYEYNTICYPETGWIFNHADDVDMWVSGDDIGVIERHYEK